MVWNTIAYPKMMDDDNPGGLGITRTCSPIKFADAHKLSFYDIIVSITGTTADQQLILVKGDFETLKHMILDDEVVCGAIFASAAADDGSSIEQDRSDFVAVEYIADTNVIAFTAADADNSKTVYLLSDNTITKSLS